MTNIEYEVLQFARIAHHGQKRKYTGEDYIVHPIEVALAVEADGGDQNMILAAILHDVLEDTDVTHSALRAFLHRVMEEPTDAEDVLALVVELTDVYTKDQFGALNRAARKHLEAIRLSTCSDRAIAIKRADIDNNTRSIDEHDPKFAKVYHKEKDYLLDLFDNKVS